MKVNDTIQPKGLVIPESNNLMWERKRERRREKKGGKRKRDRYFTPISINIIEWKM